MTSSAARFAFLAAIGVFLLAVGAGSLGPATASASAAGGYATEVSVEPSAKQEGAFLCKAIVKNLATGAVEVAPVVLAAAGEQAETTSTAPGGPTLRFIVQVDPDAARASYSLSLSSQGADTLLHRGTVRLAAQAAKS